MNSQDRPRKTWRSWAVRGKRTTVLALAGALVVVLVFGVTIYRNYPTWHARRMTARLHGHWDSLELMDDDPREKIIVSFYADGAGRVTGYKTLKGRKKKTDINDFRYSVQTVGFGSAELVISEQLSSSSKEERNTFRFAGFDSLIIELDDAGGPDLHLRRLRTDRDPHEVLRRPQGQ